MIAARCSGWVLGLLVGALVASVPAKGQDSSDALLDEIRASYEWRLEQLEWLELTFQGSDTQGVALDGEAAPLTSVEGMIHDGSLILWPDYGLRLDRNRDILNLSTLESYESVLSTYVRMESLGESWSYVPHLNAGSVGAEDNISNWADVQYLLFSYREDVPFLTGRVPMSAEPVVASEALLAGLSEADRAQMDALAATLSLRDTVYVGMVETEEGPRAMIRTVPRLPEGYEAGADGQVGIPVGNMLLGAAYTETDYWLDPERDYVMTHMTARTPEGRMVEEVRLAYAEDADLGFVPAGLEYTVYGPQGEIRSRLKRTCRGGEGEHASGRSPLREAFPQRRQGEGHHPEPRVRRGRGAPGGLCAVGRGWRCKRSPADSIRQRHAQGERAG